MTTTVTNTLEAFELQTITPSKVQHQSAHHTGARDTQRSPSIHVSSHGDAISTPELPPRQSPAKSNLQIVFTIFMPSFVSFLASFSNGLITVGLPDIARSLSLERALYLWPSSVYGLTSGASLLIAGSIADIVGARTVELLGITLMGVFSLSCGFSQTGEQLVAFRALQGVALAMHLPSSVALISGVVPSGRARNFGFACLGFSQPLGFAVGLVVSGVLVEKAGWRSGFYLCGGATMAAAIAAIWTLPKFRTGEPESTKSLCKKVARDIDWVGGLLSSAGLAMLAYVLA